MKNNYLLTFFRLGVVICIYFLFLSCELSYAGLWRHLSPTTTSNTLKGVYFASATKGWAVGEKGTIIKTNDGGQNWIHVPIGFVNNFRDVHFANEYKGWIIGDDGIILNTEDGGNTWQVQASGVNTYLNAVEFVNETHGWIVGSYGVVLKTVDGGQTWIKKSSGTSYTLNAVDFVDEQYGWAVGYDEVIIRTTDGGETWLVKSSGFYDLYSVSFVNRTTGWAVGRSGKIMKTTNGGASWSSQSSGVTSYLRGVQFIDEDYGWIIGGTEILYSSNGGSSWSTQAASTSSSFYGLYFIDSNTGWIVGYGGNVEFTTNAGTQWNSQKIGSIDSQIEAIQFLDSNSGWAVGRSGKIVKTIDGGYTWNEMTTEVSSDLKDVFFLDNMNGWIVGGSDVVLKTNDGGNNWTQLTTEIDTYNWLNKVQFIDNVNGWILTSNEIFITNDGGAKWHERSPGWSNNDMFFINNSTGWVVGSSGSIKKTTNGGWNWFEQSSNVTQQLFGVHATSQDTVWAVGASGTVIRTFNGGTNWEIVDIGSNRYLNGIYFITKKFGIILSSSGELICTYDSGDNWYSMATGSGSVKDISFINKDDGWALTNGLLFHDKEFFQNPKIAVIPSGIDFGQVPIGWDKETSVTILNIGGEFLDIQNITSNNSDFTVSASSGSIFTTNKLELSITYTPSVSGNIQANIVIQSNDPDNPVFHIPLKALGREYPIVFVDKNATGNGDGASWTNAMTSIQPAINLAHELNGLDVWVAKGTYFENLSILANVGMYGGFNGNETEISERDIENNPTIIDGRRRGSVIEFPWNKNNMVVDGFTITRGTTYGLDVDDVGSTTIRNCIIEDNSGTGIWLRGFGTSNTISRCLIRDNNYGIDANNSETIIFNNTIVNNSSAGIKAIGYYVPTPTIYNCILWNNGDDLAYSARAMYSCIQDGNSGDGNISENPSFGENFHLSWDSPCLDIGAPWSPYDPDGTPPDIGAYFFDQSDRLGYIAGKVTNAQTNTPIFLTTVRLSGPNEQKTYTNLNGEFNMIDRVANDYQVAFYAPNYDSVIVPDINIIPRGIITTNATLNPIIAPPRFVRSEVNETKTKLRWHSPAQVVALDDGSFDNAIGFNNIQGCIAIGPFMPAVYPAFIEKALVSFNGERAGDNVDINVYIDPSGLADRPSDFFHAGSVKGITISQTGNFQEIDLTSLNLVVSSGNFFIGVMQNSTEPMMLRWDHDELGDMAFYDSNLDGFFTMFKEMSSPFPGVPGIRAVISVQSNRPTTTQNSDDQMEMGAEDISSSSSNDPVNSFVFTQPVVHVHSNKNSSEKSLSKGRFDTSPFFALLGYRIYKSETLPVEMNDTNFLGVTDVYTTSFLDKSIEANKKYYYLVSAEYNGGESEIESAIEVNVHTFGAGPTVRLEHESKHFRLKKQIISKVVIDSVENLGSFQFSILYDGALIETKPENISVGSFIGSTGRIVSTIEPVVDNRIGELTFEATTEGQQGGASIRSGGILATIEWTPIDTGLVSLDLIDIQLTDTENNSYDNIKSLDEVIHITDPFWADIDADKDVDVIDIELVASHWNTNMGDPDYDPICDVDEEGIGDGDVDIADIQLVALWWNQEIPQSNQKIVSGLSNDYTFQNTTFKILPIGEIEQGIYQFEIWVNNVNNLAGFQFDLSNKGQKPTIQEIKLGSFLQKTGRNCISMDLKSNTNKDILCFGGYSIGKNHGASGSGVIAIVNLKSGTPALDIENIQIIDTYGNQFTSPKAILTNSIHTAPNTFYLNQNYPNPFNMTTHISYGIPSSAGKPLKVTLMIYNLLGKEVRTLVNDEKSAGNHNVIWHGKDDNGNELASGLYYYTFAAGNFQCTKKIMLLK